MRRRFFITLLSLGSLLTAPALLAQSSKTTREKATTRSTRRRAEGPRAAEPTVKKATPKTKRETSATSGRPKVTTRKRTEEKPTAETVPPKPKRSGTSTAPAGRVEAKPTAKPEVKKATDTRPTAPKVDPGTSKSVVVPEPGAKPKSTTRSGANPLAAADQAYFKRSYAAALKQYQEAVRQRLVPQERRPLIDYRIARSLGFTEQWDASIAEALKVAARYPNTIWDARSKSWLMRMYLKAPHTGWKVGERYVRGKDAPETDAAAQPQQVDLTLEDWRKAVLYGEQSKSLYEKLREETKGTGEETDLTSDLAHLIAGAQLPSWADGHRWKPPADDSWKLDPSASYDPAWAPPRKVFQLYLSAEEVGTKAQKPLVRLGQARWLHIYQILMQREAWRVEPSGERKPIPYPYEDRSAPEVLRTLTRDFPEHSLADYALFTAGNWLNEEKRYAEALEVYAALAKARPDTQWALAAKSAAADITRSSLTVEAPKPQAPGKKAALTLSARNVATLKFAAYSLKLEDVVKDGRVLSRPRSGISELLARIGKTAGLKKFYQGDPVTWEQTLTPKNEFDWIKTSIETPLTKNGAYAVEVVGGPVRSTVVLIVSDLAAMQIVDQDRATAMVVNAETGAPVSDAQVLIREVYTDPDKKQRVSAATSTSSAEGLVEKPLAPKRLQSDDVLSFAWKGDRYAFTEGTNRDRSSDGEETTTYIYTDRPVYRPGQRVNFRALLAERDEQGNWKPLPDQKAKVEVIDAADARVDTREVSTNGFGAASGSFVLGARPTLGRYRVNVTWGEKESPGRGGSIFSVEEYKKPEFSATISPGDSAARVGEPLKVRISARYYFGAPVANAKVKYQAQRSEWLAPSPFAGQGQAFTGGLGGLPSGLAPDYSSAFDPNYEQLPYTPPIEGTAVTDANGDAVITLDTKIADPRFQGRHLTFDVTAEVTDASRRTIESHGEVRALATQFNAFVQSTRGFVSAGEPLTAEVRTTDAAGRPVAASGTGRVFRVVAEGDKTRMEEVFSGLARTDATGKGTFTWIQSRPGRYEVRFEAFDAWEQRVSGSSEAWVAGDSAGEGVSAAMQVRLIPELRSYRPGQKARVLLVSDQPNSTVFLTQQAGPKILEQRVLRVDGRSTVLEIALSRTASPSLLVTASGIRKRRFFHAEATVKVPAVEQLLTVDVTPDKSVYKPGEQAVLRVRARDAMGQPVRADVSTGVIDTSLFAIAEQEREPIGESLYRYRQGRSFYPQASLERTIDSTEEDQQPPSKRVRPPATPSEGLGNIEPELLNNLPGNRFYTVEEAPPEFAEVTSDQAEPSGSALKRAPGPAESMVRKNFADTAFWTPSVVTDTNGEATVTFTWPDNLTQWQVLARGWSESGQVGESRAEVTTAKDLLVRLQAPRFFVERDELVLSANVHNYTPTAQKVKVSLQLEGQTLVPAGSAAPGPPAPRSLNVPRADRPGGAITFSEESASGDALVQWIEVPSGSEQRVDWRVRVDRPGEAKIRVLAEAEADNDAVELTFPVLAHGVEKHVQKSGAILMGTGEKPGTRTEKVTVTIPTERAPDAGELVVTVSPSSGMVMLDALPYLAGYPYGCTEQTLSRFMPSVVSAKVLQDLGLDLDDLRKRIDKGEGPAARGRNPVFQAATLKKMTTEGLERLRRFQLANGGWGWWENDTSDDRITAYVVQGLLAGKEAGVAVPASMLDRGLAYLEGRFAKETNLHDRVNQGWVLSLDRKRAPAVANALLESVYPKRERLTAYGLSLLALTLKNGGHAPEARVCMENLENTARIDKESGTCSWTRNLGTWWAWYNQDVETTAACLRVFNALEPKHRLAPMIVRWLANNRIGNSWSSTRDTALVVYALAEYVKGQRELEPDYTLTVDVGGRQKKTFRVNAENALTFDNRLIIPATSLGSGAQEITVTREGGGNVYFTAALRYFTLEEGVKAAGNEIRVRRRYYRLTKPEPDSKDELTKDGYRRTTVNAGDRLTSSDLLEVELLVESKNAYEQLVFEDMKPSGCEPVELRSGTRYGGLCSNLELRDDRVAFFVTNLPQGKRLLSYRMRAETPGTFHALPLTGYAMYAPAIRCISDEGNFSVEDTTSVKR